MGFSASFGRRGVVGLGIESCIHWTCTVSHEINKGLIVSNSESKMAKL